MTVGGKGDAIQAVMKGEEVMKLRPWGHWGRQHSGEVGNNRAQLPAPRWCRGEAGRASEAWVMAKLWAGVVKEA